MAETATKPKSEIRKIIEWYEDDIRRYKGMIGQETEYRTIVTQELIDNVQRRVDELKQREEMWNATRRRFSKQN